MVCDLVYGAGEFLGVLKHRVDVTKHKRGNERIGIEHEKSAKRRDKNVLEVAKEVHTRAHDRAPDAREDTALLELTARHAEVLYRLALLAVRNDRLVRGDHLLDLTVERADKLLPLDEIFTHKLCKICGYRDGHRNSDAGDERHYPAVIYHHCESSDEREYARYERSYRLRDRV